MYVVIKQKQNINKCYFKLKLINLIYYGYYLFSVSMVTQVYDNWNNKCKFLTKCSWINQILLFDWPNVAFSYRYTTMFTGKYHVILLQIPESRIQFRSSQMFTILLLSIYYEIILDF